MSEPRAFDFLGALPGRGTTMLEASAGTGKTFTIAALVTRYVAEGVPIDRILAVTFTRMATAELRGRVRDRLVSAQELLTLVVDAGVKPPDDDKLVTHLADGDVEVVAARRDRLSAAIANFDAATITTTHGFCHLVLAGLGVAGSVAPGSVLTDDPGDTLSEVVDDLYVRWVLLHGRPFPLKVARAVAAAAVGNPDTPIVDAEPGSDTDVEVRLARAARDEVGRRLVEAGLLTYDDLLVRLKGALIDPERGRVACQLLRDSYSVVLVDEFQDTDPIQWDVVRAAFGTGDTTLVMIGDPKQAIYSFRGGDVHCYLDATASATSRFTLAENWRSDADLLAAFDALIEPLELGHPEIPYRVVRAPAEHGLPGIDGLPSRSALRVRLVAESGSYPTIKRNKTGFVKGSAEEWIARDLADDIVRSLRAGATLTRPPYEGMPIAPGHIAVLVRTNRQAVHVEAALSNAGVPAVMGSTASVFTTQAGRDWLSLLEALEQPASRPRVAALALTPFMGMSAREIATMEEARWEDLHALVRSWTETLRNRGVAALYLAVMAESSLPERVLAERNGARLMTDLGHVAQLLHSENSVGAQGAPALRAWLARRCEASGDESLEERSRRLDSDADAVQVLTIHRSKGLEFPIVYCPYLWDAARVPNLGGPVVFHDQGPDAGSGSSRRLDVTGRDKSASYKDHHKIAAMEQKGEDLRLLYVALTRARHQVVVWWAGTSDSMGSPLARLLTRRAGDSAAAAGRYRPKLAELTGRIDEMSDRTAGAIGAEICEEPAGEVWDPGAPGQIDLDVAEFGRRLDSSWRRNSYSSITAAAHTDTFDVVSSEPEEPGTVDEPDAPNGAEAAIADRGHEGLAAVPCLLSDVPGGTQFGTFVHHILERVDFAATDLAGEVRSAVATEMARLPADIGPEGVLVGGLVAAIETPLGPLAGGTRLRDIDRRDRLDELSFEFPLAGGDRPEGSVSVSDIASLLDRHLDPSGPLAGYPSRLRGTAMQSDLRGYLTGSLDLVFRAPAARGGGARYFVADYKTNRLARSPSPLTAWHYRPEALDAEMQLAHYPLQAILYSVALHRYLRWRVAGYQPEQHLGGVLYLFLRGMTGPDCPRVGGTPCGVFAWAPPTAMVRELSDLLDGSLITGGSP